MTEPGGAARQHCQVTFALLALALGFLVGLAIPQRGPADALASNATGDLPERASKVPVPPRREPARR